MSNDSKKSNGGRPVTGRPKWSESKGHWQAFCAVDGRLRPFPMRGIAREDVARATAVAKAIAMTLKNGGAVEVGEEETLNEWMDGWLSDREMRGMTSVRDDRAHLVNHVCPLIGTKAMRQIGTSDIEAVVQDLDRKARLPEGDPKYISPKTAQNVWGTLRKAFDDAANAKTLSLRVRALGDNPAANVRGPDRGTPKGKQFLYPSEFLKFVECSAVPLRWRIAVTLAIYLFPRDGELRVLRWEDGAFDLDHGTVHIHEAWNRRTKKTKETKTGLSRRFSVERALLPLLLALKAEAKNVGPVIELPSERDMSRGLRRWLAKAGITRPELFRSSRTSKPLTWHDLRATGLTWMAVRGDDPLKIQQRAGHRVFSTTAIYLRTAESIRVGFGEAFPALPSSLFPDPSFSARTGFGESFDETKELTPVTTEDYGGLMRGGRDSNLVADVDIATEKVGFRSEVPAENAPEAAPSAPSEPETVGPSEVPADDLDDVERALALAITNASAAGQWSTVAALAGELSARRMAKAGNVIPIRPKAKSST
jgi:integrase